MTDTGQTDRHTCAQYLIPAAAAAAAGVRKGEMGGTGLAVDAIGVGGVEPEPSPVAVDILPHTRTLGENGELYTTPHSSSWQRPNLEKELNGEIHINSYYNKIRRQEISCNSITSTF